MTTKLPFTELKVRRAVEACRKAGVRVAKVEVKPDGSIIVHDGDNDNSGLPASGGAGHAPGTPAWGVFKA